MARHPDEARAQKGEVERGKDDLVGEEHASRVDLVQLRPAFVVAAGHDNMVPDSSTGACFSAKTDARLSIPGEDGRACEHAQRRLLRVHL